MRNDQRWDVSPSHASDTALRYFLLGQAASTWLPLTTHSQLHHPIFQQTDAVDNATLHMYYSGTEGARWEPFNITPMGANSMLLAHLHVRPNAPHRACV